MADAAERQRVIDAACANLKQYYIDHHAALKMADALLASSKKGVYESVTDGAALADLLTRQIREISHDMHLEVVYSPTPLPHLPQGPSPDDQERYRRAMKLEKCTFEKVEVLAHNIGYLKINSFPDPAVCEATASTAMASLNRVDAIIYDLRDNRGGEPAMVMFMAAYLFDHPEYMYNPRENTSRKSWTQPVPGNKLTDKPVYILTSGRTFSGAEQFCFNLKMLKRATLVGETTGGAAHAGVFHRIDDHFGIGILETRAINPFSSVDWEGTGVEPDVKVAAADALETAKALAENKHE
jgi:C-terminal processing protease CtpA/Prc